MAQPSVANYFNSRKRSAIEDNKINRAKKVLLLDSNNFSSASRNGLESVKKIEVVEKNEGLLSQQSDKLQEKKEGDLISFNKIASIPSSERSKLVPRKRATSRSKPRGITTSKNIQELLNNMKNKLDHKTNEVPIDLPETTVVEKLNRQINEIEKHVTPPNSPIKTVNALDKVKDKPDGPSLKEIRRKMTRSARLAELKASINRLQEGDKKLKEIEKKTEQILESPKLQRFRSIELEVNTSPTKVFSPEKCYLSPKKDASARRNLLQQFTPTKNAVPVIPDSPSKQILQDIAKPALTLPYKYRHLAEIFRSIDIVCQILFNRKECITFRKVKPAVEEMMKRSLLEKHLAQIKYIYPDAFEFSQEKLKVFGTGMKKEQWELVIKPLIPSNQMTSDILLDRRRKLFAILLDKVKNYHEEFLLTLDPPMVVSKNEIKRWHPEFNIEMIPDIETAELPQPPAEDKMTTGKDVLEKARQMFNCNTKMEQALQRLKEAKEKNTVPVPEEPPKEMPTSVLKGIPKALLEKVRQKQAAKALVSMTRTAEKEKLVETYSRLPEIARLTRNIFVAEKKSVLSLETVIEKLGNCYRTTLSKSEMEEHLRIIEKEVPNWLIFHFLRKCDYIKLNKDADLSIVIAKLEYLAKQKSDQ
nr:unnamed protein product [Callosobruchus analis]